MKEGVPRPIGKFDEAKAFLGIEPFDDTADRWTRGSLEGRSGEAGSGSESTGRWLVGIGVEVATPRMTKILLSHFASWGWCLISSIGRRSVLHYMSEGGGLGKTDRHQ